MEPSLISPIKLILASKDSQYVKNNGSIYTPMSTSSSSNTFRRNNSSVLQKNLSQSSFIAQKKKKKQRTFTVKERLQPKSTWSLLPRHARKFLTIREKQVVPTTFALELKTNLLQSFVEAVDERVNPIEDGDDKYKNIYSSLRKHPFILAASKQLWYILLNTGEDTIDITQFSILCHKIALLITGISSREDVEDGVDTLIVDNNNYCNFQQFRNAILLIVNQCSPLYNRPVDYVEWTNRLMELLTYDAGNAMITFKSDEDITSLTLVPRTPWTDVSMDFIQGENENPENEELEKKKDPEAGFLGRAKLNYRTKIAKAFKQYPYKASENPKIRWQPMRTWQLREMRLAKMARQKKNQQLYNENSNTLPVDAEENRSRNSALPSQWEKGGSSFVPSKEAGSSNNNNNSSSSNFNDDNENSSNNLDSISINGSKKSMINWKYKLVTMEDKEKQMNETKLRGEKRNNIKKRYPWQDRYGPYSNSGVDLTTYTEFEDLSRLSMSHYRVLADGTKLCSKHNDITFDKAMREKKLKKRDYIYTTTLAPLPDGHSIVEEFARFTLPMQCTNDLRQHNPPRNYKISQLRQLSCLQLGTPLPLVPFPYKRNKRKNKKKRSSNIKTGSFQHKYVFNESNPWTYDGIKHQESIASIIHNQNPSTSISLVKEEKRSKELLKEADYIEKALECEARAKIRAQQILEEKMAAMY